jgi:hypothetical protein
MANQEKTLADLKAKHGKIYIVEIDDDENEGKKIVGYFKKLDFMTASAYASMAGSDPLKAQKLLVSKTIISEHSDPRILEEWEYTVAAGDALSKLIKLPNAVATKH